MSPPAYFDEYSDKYMCCCGCMHVKTGVKVILGLAVLGMVFVIIGIIGNSSSLGTSLAGLAISVISIGCLLVSLFTEKPAFVVPYLVLQILNVVLYIVVLVLLIIDVNDDKIDSGTFVLGLVGCAVLIFLPLWFVFVVYGYYKFLKDKSELGAPIVYNSA